MTDTTPLMDKNLFDAEWDRTELLSIVKKYNKQMRIMNTAANYEELWYQLPGGLLDVWHEAEHVVLAVERDEQDTPQ